MRTVVTAIRDRYVLWTAEEHRTKFTVTFFISLVVAGVVTDNLEGFGARFAVAAAVSAATTAILMTAWLGGRRKRFRRRR